MNKITRNAAKCLNCNDIIESKHRHDFVTCKCGNLSVDGGLDYLKRSCGQGAYTDLSMATYTEPSPDTIFKEIINDKET